MLVRAVLERYEREHVTYLTTDYPRVFGFKANRLIEHLGRKHIDKISPDLCREYTKKRTEQGAASGTIRGELSVLTSAAAWGVRAKWLAPVDMPVVVLPPPSAEREIVASREQGKKLIDEAFKVSWRCGMFVVLGLFTGARPSRIRYLEWAAVDMKAEIIDYTHNAPKNSRKRYVRVRMMIELIPYMQRAAKVRGRGPYVLGCTTDIADQLARAATNAGFEEGVITPNSLRHIWATWSAEDGVDLWMIARVLGNTLKTVEKKYAHFHPSYQREATQRKFFAQTEGPELW